MTRVPLVAPTPELLRADAVWITISNWAAALAERYGDSGILAGGKLLARTDVQRFAFGRSDQPAHAQNKTILARLPTPLKESLKDIRWLRAGRNGSTVDVERFEGTPYVWQHHDRFHSNGRSIADRLAVPLVHFVDAPQVWESEQWGVGRGLLGPAIERFGEVPQIRSADVIACVSQAVAQATIERLGADPRKIVIAPCTVDPTRFPIGQNLGETKPDSPVVVGWIGSFRRFHALDMIVDAFAEAAVQHPELRLVLAGDGPMRPEIEAYVRSLGIASRVQFLGYVPYPEVPAELMKFDIAALPAASGDFHYSPLKLREYAAAGSAIVACDVGDVASSLVPSKECILTPPGDVRAFADAIGELTRSPALRMRLGAAARQAARERFGMEPALIAIEQLLGESPSRSPRGG